MDFYHRFDVIGNQITGGQNIVHAGVALGRTVTAGDDAEFTGCAARPIYSFFYGFCHLAQVIVPWYEFVPGIGDANQWAFQIIVGIADGFKYTAVKRPFRSS